MSKGPVGIGTVCIEATKKKYINMSFDKSVYCGYEGECPKNLMVFYEDRVCLLCKYRKKLDIPQMIFEHQKLQGDKT